MYNVMVAGAGKMGSMIACLLSRTGDYQVHLADNLFESSVIITHLLQKNSTIKKAILNLQDINATEAYLSKHHIEAVISSVPYFLSLNVAEACKAYGAHYFDLTEDTHTNAKIKSLAENSNTGFVPQCGLAPGFISIAAHSLMQTFDACHVAKLRTGALPECTSNGLNYALNWSTDGLINEYGNPCFEISSGELSVTPALMGLETLMIDGCQYETFHTSGGIGSLIEIYKGRIQTLNYKTIRYPGHCEKMRFLMQDLRLNSERETLKRILERAIPRVSQDIVIIYVSVEGTQNGELLEKSYLKKIYPQEIDGLTWTAIQVSTAASICYVVDTVLGSPEKYRGLVLQERFDLSDMLTNRFGRYFA